MTCVSKTSFLDARCRAVAPQDTLLDGRPVIRGQLRLLDPGPVLSVVIIWSIGVTAVELWSVGRSLVVPLFKGAEISSLQVRS